MKEHNAIKSCLITLFSKNQTMSTDKADVFLGSPDAKDDLEVDGSKLVRSHHQSACNVYLLHVVLKLLSMHV